MLEEFKTDPIEWKKIYLLYGKNVTGREILNYFREEYGMGLYEFKQRMLYAITEGIFESKQIILNDAMTFTSHAEDIFIEI